MSVNTTIRLDVERNGHGFKLDVDISTSGPTLMCECGQPLYQVRYPHSTVDDLLIAIATHSHREY